MEMTMIIKNIRKRFYTTTLMALIIASSIMILNPISNASATKTSNCTSSSDPKGIDFVSTVEVWIAAGSGNLDKFTSFSPCTKATSNVGGDPHSIDRTTTTQVSFSEHLGDKITYFDPTTGVQIVCAGTAIDGPGDTDNNGSGSQYTTDNFKGTVIKTVKGTSSCTVTVYPVTGTSPKPEGIVMSTDVGGFLVIDQNNKKVWKMTTSGVFTLCKDFSTILGAPQPWYVTANDSQDIFGVTFRDEQKIRYLGTLSCLVAQTSGTAPGQVFQVEIAGDGVDAYVNYQNNAKVSRYDTTTNTFTTDDWNTECLSCFGFGLDSQISTNTYYATMSSGSSANKIVKGSIP